MNKQHLDSEAIDRYVAGQREADAERHLSECAECREAVGRVELTLARFRNSARLWSEGTHPVQWGAPSHPSRDRRERSLLRARWVALAAAAVALAAVPLYRNYEQRRAQAQAKADALLLEQVSADISRPAPEPLEPLIELVSQSSTGEKQ